MPDDTEFEKILKLWEQAVKGGKIRRANDVCGPGGILLPLLVELQGYVDKIMQKRTSHWWWPRCHILLLMPTKQVSLLSFFLDDPHMIFQYLPFLEKNYSYIWSGLWWSTTWLRLLHSLETWRGEKAWEEERCKSQKYSQVEDYELLREVEINVLDIEHRTCSISLQDGGESHWPAWCYEWTRGAIV